MPRLPLERPDRSARRTLVDVLARAFRDNPMNRAIHGPDPARRVRANRAGLRALVLDLHSWTEARVIHNEGRVVGGFVAVPPGCFPLPGASLRRQLGCLFWQGARAMDRWGFVSESLVREHPLEPHWYLAVLGVDPEYQGRGIGTQLIDGLRALAHTESLPIYLESDRPESVAFYRARGFETLGELRPLDVACWRLGWDPEPRSSGEASDLCNAVARRSAFDEFSPTVAAHRAARSEVAT
ncbi:MAG: GNAT family N-acetyltransferase [Deltaproteobacteria bacterium]|nr:GNAT family N-acetyltransferase [Deltaproteobacteria bacterium]